MPNRIGLELLPDVCRLVQVQTSAGWFKRRPSGGASRVKAFREIPFSPSHPRGCADELRRQLGGRGGDVCLAIWGLRSAHQTLYLPQADPSDLESMARREARSKLTGSAAAVPLSDGIMVGEHREGGRLEIGYVSVTPGEIQSRIQPFVDAGFSVSSVVTPAVAHAALVRQRWGQFADAATAVLSVNARVTAITVVRGGVVLFARELPWGHQTERADRGYVFDAVAFAGQLSSELRRSLVFLKQQSKVDVTHVLVCGDLPDLRALTGPLMHELNVDVETLDSLEGFDVAHLPEPADEFRAQVGALRTAWVLTTDAVPPVDLRPADGGAARFATAMDKPARTRLAAAALVGLLVAAAAFAASEFAVRRSRAGADALRRQVATLEPEIQRLEAARVAAAMVGARSAAMAAFASQGPRLAKVLESLASGAPGEIAIGSLTVSPGIGTWRVTVKGQVLASTPALAQAVFNQFLRGATTSVLLGPAVRPPTTRVQADEPPSSAAAAGGATGSATSGVASGDKIRPLQRVVGFELVEGGEAGRRTSELLGRRPLRIAPEEHWYLHPGGVPKSVLEGVARFNAEQARLEQAVLGSTGSEGEPVRRRLGSMLEFSVEFEVRK